MLSFSKLIVGYSIAMSIIFPNTGNSIHKDVAPIEFSGDILQPSDDNHGISLDKETLNIVIDDKCQTEDDSQWCDVWANVDARLWFNSPNNESVSVFFPYPATDQDIFYESNTFTEIKDTIKITINNKEITDWEEKMVKNDYNPFSQGIMYKDLQFDKGENVIQITYSYPLSGVYGNRLNRFRYVMTTASAWGNGVINEFESTVKFNNLFSKDQIINPSYTWVFTANDAMTFKFTNFIPRMDIDFVYIDNKTWKEWEKLKNKSFNSETVRKKLDFLSDLIGNKGMVYPSDSEDIAPGMYNEYVKLVYYAIGNNIATDEEYIFYIEYLINGCNERYSTVQKEYEDYREYDNEEEKAYLEEQWNTYKEGIVKELNIIANKDIQDWCGIDIENEIEKVQNMELKCDESISSGGNSSSSQTNDRVQHPDESKYVLLIIGSGIVGLLVGSVLSFALGKLRRR